MPAVTDGSRARSYFGWASPNEIKSFRYNERGRQLLAHLGKHAIVIGASMGGLLGGGDLSVHVADNQIRDADVPFDG